MSYTFDITLQYNSVAVIKIDTEALYGYWEHSDGSEGGGLWFDKNCDGILELADYDGAFELPIKVLKALESARVFVDDVFWSE